MRCRCCYERDFLNTPLSFISQSYEAKMMCLFNFAEDDVFIFSLVAGVSPSVVRSKVEALSVHWFTKVIAIEIVLKNY